MAEQDLVQRIEQRLRLEKRSSENAKLRAATNVSITSEQVGQLADRGICSHWVPREVVVTQVCSFNGAPNDCTMKVFEKHAAGWIFSFCPGKK